MKTEINKEFQESMDVHFKSIALYKKHEHESDQSIINNCIKNIEKNQMFTQGFITASFKFGIIDQETYSSFSQRNSKESLDAIQAFETL